jgi:L-iditol 2-dehydrogenase
MKALVLTDYNNFQIQDVPQPDCGSDEVLLRVRACGICGSDIHGMDGSTGRRRPPIIMGHEASGEIAEVGPDVQGFQQGDRVTFDSTVYCGRCRYCMAGDVHLCDHRRVLGVSCDEYRCHGAFAQYVAVPARILYRLPEAVSFQRAALVEPTSIAFHAVHRMKIHLADTAVVVGTGMVGLLVVQALRAAGCGQLIAVDLDPRRLRLASELGADVTLDASRVDAPAEVARLTEGRGADVAAEVAGNTTAVQTAVGCLRKGGQLSLVGNLSPTIELPLQAVVTRELSLLGSCASRGDYPACLEMIARGTIRVDPLISATARLDDGAVWFKRLYAGEEGMLKVVLEP